MLGAFARRAVSTAGFRPLGLQLSRSFLVPMLGQFCSKGVFGRQMSSTKDETLYVPFLTDAERERASIFFWVTRNTNLKGVNVTKKVGTFQTVLNGREPISPSGVFHLIVTSRLEIAPPCLCTRTRTQ